MPQMAPINWLILFLLFSIIMIMFNIMNYFIYSASLPKESITNLKLNSLIWKW
uniref:ATP synthase complex subunit 8 n=1 Tax=Acanthacorydalis sinensis TaxID=2028584 RepID=A0A8K1T7C5_9NEOP|nr:ATP synthase F0 subunit 8 [Acanthacorydalis sinensis]